MEKLDNIIPFTRDDKAWVSSLSTPGAYDPILGKPAPPPGRGHFLLKQGTERIPGHRFETVMTPTEIKYGWHDTDARFYGQRHRASPSGRLQHEWQAILGRDRKTTLALVQQLRPRYPSLWATIERVSADTGVHTSTVRAWVRREAGAEVVKPLAVDRDAELAALRAEMEALRAAHRELVEANRGIA
ncbi:hypothetical protein GS582_31985 [Rhodococcus hoagii]|nr:hypothetical protein [Prescottella equi]